MKKDKTKDNAFSYLIYPFHPCKSFLLAHFSDKNIVQNSALIVQILKIVITTGLL
jgi:hypothetical protein